MYGTAIGAESSAGEYGTATGASATATGMESTANGTYAQATGDFSIAVGSNANASEMNTISIGSYSSASATDSVALGYGASATEENSVALGTNSTTSTVVSTATGTIAGTTYTNLSTDVTNLGTEVSNLSTKVNGFDGRINRLDNKVNKAVAGSAALAALHPLDFNPDDKWSFAVGYGNYNSANAMAVGAFYRPSEDTMISIGGAMGNGENIVNAGLSFKLGQSNGVSKSKVTMAREIVELRSDNRMMKDQIAALTDKVNALMGILDTSKKATFPDVPENH